MAVRTVGLLEPIEHLVADTEGGLSNTITLIATVNRADSAPVGSQNREGDLPKLETSQLNAIQDVEKPILLGIYISPEHYLKVFSHP